MTDRPPNTHPDPLPPDALALDRQLCFAVYSAAHAFNRTYKPLLDPYGLTYPQYLVLLSLWEEDGRTVKALGAALGLDSGTLSPLLKRLEASGYIRRARDRADERQVIVTLTGKGRAMQEEAGAIRMEIGRASGCSLAALEELNSTLQRLTANLRAGQEADAAEGAA
ncbi:MarR family winged helix-turn-helix transcriptional regulator [Shinella pollutisoli]|uniref:MarR family winged helix-turn-helix transcriptional regulator n=1 Tax=Shinella pollutisoli TaxID=2250594 RepID=A0ABV7DMZ2_9HYPH|nr:MarR family transcriptional regulator [Shinella pollutisoli]